MEKSKSDNLSKGDIIRNIKKKRHTAMISLESMI